MDVRFLITFYTLSDSFSLQHSSTAELRGSGPAGLLSVVLDEEVDGAAGRPWQYKRSPLAHLGPQEGAFSSLFPLNICLSVWGNGWSPRRQQHIPKI